jgi:hypothetical protein
MLLCNRSSNMAHRHTTYEAEAVMQLELMKETGYNEAAFSRSSTYEHETPG